jgi:ubiquinone/menaquinone biosynthesis C-methylase UbiE
MMEILTDRKIELYIEEMQFASLTRRGMDYYSKAFGYKDRKTLKDKLILDVGSGNSRFSYEAVDYGATVINLDGKSFEGKGKFFKNSVLGIAQYLPFKDNVFDETISSWCFYHIRTGIDKALLEAIRVTKPGGKIKIHPATCANLHYNQHVSIVDCSELDGTGKTLIIDKNPDVSMYDWLLWIDKALPTLRFRT